MTSLLAPTPGWTARGDVVIVGSGVAGLTAALHARRTGRTVLLVTKGRVEEGSTRWAQGGIAAALADDDTPEEHLHDTLVAGAGLCDVDAVAALVNEGPDCVRSLIDLGAHFDLDSSGAIALTREGGHHRDRIAHAGGDATGAEISRALVAAVALDPGIELIEGALVLIDPHTGEVRSMAGGYDYTQSQFNRVTQSLRQPGSSFKPVIYLAAIDKFHYTPSTIMIDTARTFKVGDTFWTPANFDEQFLGPITLRTALEKSRNLVSADIVSRIGVDPAIQYARTLGIRSPLGRNLSLSLGSSEVTPLEMTRAYGVFAARGVLFDSVFITKITDRFGKVLYDYEAEKASKGQQVITEDSAFVMANLMKGVVDHGTGYRVKELGRPVAGKTGTSNDQMDTWFIGYTPSWVCGVWVGFDQKKQIGPKETGGVVAAPIWLYFMRDFLAHQEESARGAAEAEARREAQALGIKYQPPDLAEQRDFIIPDGVDLFWVDKASGRRSSDGAPGAIQEYFLKGTEPESAALSGEEDGYELSEGTYVEAPDL